MMTFYAAAGSYQIQMCIRDSSIAVSMLFDISVVYVGVDVRKQFAADLIRLAIEDDDVNPVSYTHLLSADAKKASPFASMPSH